MYKAAGKRTASLFLMSALLALCLCQQGSAISVSFTDQSALGPLNLDVYYLNGTLKEQVNTSSVLVLDDSVIIHLKPDRTDYLRDPQLLLTDLIDWGSDNIIQLIFIVFVIGFIWQGRRR